jgi:3-phosphoshikimate 1-carboxyvinyltransferase
VRGEAALPGSKSLTNRALLLAALCDQPVRLTGALFSEDTRLMAEALRRLGCSVIADETASTLAISDQRAAFTSRQSVDLFVGLAGTAARFLTALCAAAPRGVYRIDGVPQMRKRPMAGLISALRALGADVRCTGEEGFFPLEIHARGLLGGPVSLDASESSQMLSALCMVAPLAQKAVEITLVGGVRWPFVQMTARLMENFGQPAIERRKGDVVFIPAATRYVRKDGVYAIESDATAASYFVALPLVVGGSLTLPGLQGLGQGLQGDTAFLEVAQRIGAKVTPAAGGRGIEVQFMVPGPRRGITQDFNSSNRLFTQDFSNFSDTFLTLAAIAPLLTGPTRITGIAHTRKQETDRVAGMARELRKLGQDVKEEHDALTISPRPLVPHIEIETYHDHRFAMSFGILGCLELLPNGEPWLAIKDPGCCAKTFPHFFELLGTLREKSSGS